MIINENLIPLIEKALNIKLYESQILALTKDDYSKFYGRRCGKTIIYIIKIALSSNIIYLNDIKDYTDRSSEEHHYNSWFLHEFMHIRDQLKSVGLNVCELDYRHRRPLTPTEIRNRRY